jgi:uncharacterized protein (TIGR00369 family)
MTLDVPPYAAFLGLRDAPGGVLILPFAPELIGAPGRLHGGAIAGLLEIAAHRLVQATVAPGLRLKPIGVTVDFLREGRMEDTHAAAVLLRLGRRVAHVRAEAWQQERARPIAAARLNILLAADAGPAALAGEQGTS